MSPGAHVLSFEALEQFREAWLRFGNAAQKALDGAQGEVRRAVTLLEQRRQAWHQEIRRCEEAVVQAKSELAQRRWGQKAGGGPGTTDQELALARAQRRLREAEDKEKCARQWLRDLPRDIQDFEGQVGQLSSFLEAELKRAAALLQNKSAALNAYAAANRPAARPVDEGGQTP